MEYTLIYYIEHLKNKYKFETTQVIFNNVHCTKI